MIQQVLRSLDWSMATQASLLIFFLVFLAILVRVVLQDKLEIQRLSEMALHDEPDPKAPNGGAGHG